MRKLLLILFSGISFNVYANCPAGMTTVDQYGNCYVHDGKGGVTGYSTGVVNNGNTIPRKTKPKVIYLKKPDSWGAIAITRIKKGEENLERSMTVSIDHTTKNAAKKAAIKDCENRTGRSCEYLIAWSNGCAAVVDGKTSNDLFFTFADSAPTAAETEKKTLDRCEKRNLNCKITASAQCSFPK